MPTAPETLTFVLTGTVMALWLVAAGWAIVRGIGMQRRAAFASRRADMLSAMIEGAPAQPLVVRADGMIEGMQSVGRLFGQSILPATMDDLLTGSTCLSDGGMGHIMQDIAAAQQAGKVSRHRLRTAAGRYIDLTAAPAPGLIANQGAALLWLSDATPSEDIERKLKHEREEALAAFDALTGLIEAAPFPIWFRDGDDRLALVNRAYVAAADALHATEVIDRQVELIEPVGGESARDAATRARMAGEAMARTVPVTIGTARRMMDVVDVPIADIGVASYAIDRQDLEDLRSEYRRFSDARRSMLDQMSAAVAEFGADRALRFVNRPFLSRFGLDEEWAASAPLFERVIDRLRDNGHTPEVRDFPGWRAERRGWFASTDLIEESWLLRDGSHLRTVAQPTPDGGLLLVFEDRTEQVQLASARDTLLRVRTATFDNLFEAVAVFAPDGRLHLWNQRFRKLWDVPEELLAAHPRLDILLERIADRLENARQSSVLRQMVIGATGERQQRSGRIGFADGRQFDFAAIPLPDGNALFTLIDVTDSRRIERALRDRTEALEAADQVKTDFLSRVSYELRTPLTSIGGFAEMLAGGYAGDLPEAALGYVRAILDSTALLGQQIDTVLDLAQSEAGTLPLERRTVSLVALLKDAAKAAEGSARAADVTLDLAIRPSLGAISGDARRLRQVFDQLIAAAIAGFATADAAPPGGRRVQIVGEGSQDAATIVVSDNGPGIAPVGAPAVSVALVRQLVEAHDGQCDILAQPGEGAMTSIRLPR